MFILLIIILVLVISGASFTTFKNILIKKAFESEVFEQPTNYGNSLHVYLLHHH